MPASPHSKDLASSCDSSPPGSCPPPRDAESALGSVGRMRLCLPCPALRAGQWAFLPRLWAWKCTLFGRGVRCCPCSMLRRAPPPPLPEPGTLQNLPCCLGPREVCRGGREASRLGRAGFPSSQLQSWMARGCPEASEGPVTHDRLGRLCEWEPGWGEAQRGQRRAAGRASGFGKGSGIKSPEASLGTRWEPAGCPRGRNRIYLCELEQIPDLGRWGVGRNGTAVGA